MDKRIKRILVATIAVLCFVLLPTGAMAQWVLLDARATAMVDEGLNDIYNLRYNDADSVFNELVKEYPDHPAGFFLLALVDWWRIVPNIAVDSKVDRYSKSFNERLDKTIEISNARLEKNPVDIVGLFFKAGALGYRARLTASRDFSAASVIKWGAALRDATEARELLIECQRFAPSNSDILLGSGIYNYMAEAIPEKFPAAKMFMGNFPPGDKQLGLQMLRISSDRAVYAGTEAKYTLLELLTKFEKDYGAALEVAKELHEQYPGNPVFYKYLARNYYMTSKFTQADSVWDDILARIKRREPGYELTLARQGLYYLGDIRLRRGKYEEAVEILKESDKVSNRLGDEEESSWVVMANLKLGYAYDKLNRRNDAIRQYKKVLDMDDYNGAHDLAEKYLETPYR